MLNFLRNSTGIAITDQVLVSAINFLVGIYLAYRLGISAFGQYSLVLLVVQFCLEIQRSVIHSPMFTFSAEQENKQYLAALFPLHLIVSFILSVLSGSFIFLSGYFFEKWGISRFFIPATIFTFARLQQEFSRRYYFATQKPVNTLLIDCIYAVIQITGFTLLAHQLDIEKILGLLALSCFFPLVFFKISFSFSWQHLKQAWIRHYHFSKWLFASSLASYFSSNLLLFIGSAIIGSMAAGVIKISQYVMGGMIILYQAIDNIIPYRLALFVNANQINNLKVFFKKYLAVIFAVTALHGLIVYIFIDPILLWINKGEYGTEIYEIAVGYILFTFALTATYSSQYILRAFQKTKAIFFGSITSAAIIAFSADTLIRHYHIMGILIGFFLSQISMLIIYAFYISGIFHENRAYPSR